jgi:hypothetical protein
MKSFVTISQKLNFDGNLKTFLVLLVLLVSPFVGFEKGSKNIQWHSETVLMEQLAVQYMTRPTTSRAQDDVSCVWKPASSH